MNAHSNQVDIDEAEEFLKLLDPDARGFTFQTFDDSEQKRGGLIRVMHGTLAQHADELRRLNNAGAGVFVTINETDLAGRKAENIVRVRAVFVDLDGAPLEPVLKHDPQPHMVVTSSPSKWHAYWRVEDLELGEFQDAQRGLIEHFNADPAVKDLPRVMRLPGFFHLKGEPHLVTLRNRMPDARPYSADRFRKRRSVEKRPMSDEPPPPTDNAEALAVLEREATKVTEATTGKRNSELNRAAFTVGGLIGAGLLSEDQARERLLLASDDAGLARREADKTITSGFKKGRETPWTPSLLLDPADPMRSARKMIEVRFNHQKGRLIHRHREAFWIWDGSRYALQTKEDVRATIYAFAEHARMLGRNGPEKFKPSSDKVGNICDALSACAKLSDNVDQPAWLEDDSDLPPPSEFMAVKNGLLHLPTQELWPADPTFFNTAASSVTYDPDARTPEKWLAFLAQIFGDDKQAMDAMQEFFGYCLSTDTAQQKMLLVVGPPRSGKGTMARVLRELAGPDSVAGPTMSSLSGDFGLEPLIPRPIAIISDARIGQRTDKAAVTERLLSISGEDTMSVNRKNTSFWHGKLQTRFIIITNEIPALADGSGALANRFIIVLLQTSFLGKEDPALFEKLKPELPGILNWAIEGYQRLRERGHFVQPDSATEALEEMMRIGSPVRAFVSECCEVGAGYEEDQELLWDKWKEWCARNGNQPGSKNWWGRNMKTVVPGLGRKDGGKHDYVYVGIRYTDAAFNADMTRKPPADENCPF